MKFFIILTAFTLTCIADPSPEDVFAPATEEFEFAKYSNESILTMIENDMEFACDDSGLCTIHSVTQNDRRFTASFEFGQGNNLSTGGGTTIITDGAGNLANNEPFYGVRLEYTTGRCVQKINVPRSLYIAMNRYMYDLVDENGQTKRGFEPSKEAMIMFYTSIMKQAKGCVAGN